MSLFSKVKMSPSEDEKRIEQIGSNAKAVEERDEPKRSWRNLASWQATNKTVTEVVSKTGSGRISFKTPRTKRE